MDSVLVASALIQGRQFVTPDDILAQTGAKYREALVIPPSNERKRLV